MIRYFKRLILVNFFLCISSISAFGGENFAILDLDLVLKKSELGKTLYKNLENKRKSELKNLRILEDKLKLQEEAIKKKNNIIKDEDLKKEIQLLKKNIAEFRAQKKKVQNNFTKTKNNQIIEFFEKIDPIIKLYMNENSVQILFNKKDVIVSKENLDITNEIINLINKKMNN